MRINILGFECAQEMNALNQIGYFIFKGGRASFLLLIVFGHSVMILNLVFIEIEIPSLTFFCKIASLSKKIQKKKLKNILSCLTIYLTFLSTSLNSIKLNLQGTQQQI